jgi:hypothetical protein
MPQPALQKVMVGRQPDELAEESAEMERTQASRTRHFIAGRLRGEVCLIECDRLPDAARCCASTLPKGSRESICEATAITRAFARCSKTPDLLEARRILAFFQEPIGLQGSRLLMPNPSKR